MDRSRQQTSSTTTPGEGLGQSEAFVAFREQLSRAVNVNRPILLVGERGTGKELAAAWLHYQSHRWQGPLVSLNCAALAPSLLESELFGHEAGAFTGAQKRRTGRFETANGGTFFLDEIGAAPMGVQEKILRVVEYGKFERVGSSIPVAVDVRIVSATNVDLVALAQKGRFKRDLLDRLSFEVLTLPPLRERKGDVTLLAYHFARRMAVELGRDAIPEFTTDAIGILENHSWQGNIRELKNVVERSIYRSDSTIISNIVLDPFESPYRPEADDSPADRKKAPAVSAMPDFTALPFKTAVRDLEIHMVRKALDFARYNQKKAADRLGLTYDQFRGLRRKYREHL